MILKLGSKGEKVKELQRLLKLNDDGNFGPNTRTAVINFQKSNGLKDDGMVGVRTWSKLSELNKPVVKIVPIFKESFGEDLSDPEESMPVVDIPESNPTCPNILELTNLINGSKINRTIKYVFFHCTATQPTATVSSIQRYWRETLKWRDPGYHILITADGSWTYLQDFNKPSNGVQGRNANSINISYIGGIDRNGKPLDTRTPEQEKTLEACYELLKDKLPNCLFYGHYKFSNKACPSYNVEKWISSIEESKK
jgi:N-acetylmuramoyl-L-alanine amidase